MNNKKLFNFCLILSVISLFILLLFTEFIELKETPIKNIDYKLMDQRVKTSGIITNVVETKGLYILDLKDNSNKITVLIFKKGSLILERNSFVSVEGTVSEYENQTEIIAKRILK